MWEGRPLQALHGFTNYSSTSCTITGSLKQNRRPHNGLWKLDRVEHMQLPPTESDWIRPHWMVHQSQHCLLRWVMVLQGLRQRSYISSATWFFQLEMTGIEPGTFCMRTKGSPIESQPYASFGVRGTSPEHCGKVLHHFDVVFHLSNLSFINSTGIQGREQSLLDIIFAPTYFVTSNPQKGSSALSLPLIWFNCLFPGTPVWRREGNQVWQSHLLLLLLWIKQTWLNHPAKAIALPFQVQCWHLE